MISNIGHVKHRKLTTETFEMLREVFQEHSLGRIQVFRWHARCKAGRMPLEDDDRSGRPSTSKTAENVRTKALFTDSLFQPI